ncbi:MAG: dUTP diphosphatase [Deferribacteraceae bacterium]|nr:dUTP diphosphatase [Deferribacteraceae bacterium]
MKIAVQTTPYRSDSIQFEEITVPITLKDGAKLPEYKTPNASGMDIAAYEGGVIPPGGRKLIPTGLFLEIPVGYEAQVRPRSGLALKHGIGFLNAPGTIDSDYRGELQVLLYNSSDEPFHYSKGDRIAQIVFAKVARANLIPSVSLSDTERGSGGFGSTGK